MSGREKDTSSIARERSVARERRGEREGNGEECALSFCGSAVHRELKRDGRIEGREELRSASAG